MADNLVRVAKKSKSGRVEMYVVHHQRCGHLRKATAIEEIGETFEPTVRVSGYRSHGDWDEYVDYEVHQLACRVCHARPAPPQAPKLAERTKLVPVWPREDGLIEMTSNGRARVLTRAEATTLVEDLLDALDATAPPA